VAALMNLPVEVS